MIHTPPTKRLDGRVFMQVATPRRIREELQPLFDLVDSAYEAGAKGAVLVQIDESWMRASFLPNHIAAKVLEAAKGCDAVDSEGGHAAVYFRREIDVLLVRGRKALKRQLQNVCELAALDTPAESEGGHAD